MDVLELTAFDLAKKIQQGEIKSAQAVRAYLEAIDKKDKDINGYITVCRDEAVAEAETFDQRIAKGEKAGVLAGVPVAVKDNMNTKGVLTTCGSKILENYVPVYDATVVSRLKGAGAIILGKSNMDEFAMGSSTETSFFGPTKNPLNTNRIPGGSSGGSAAIVGLKLAACALGSDTGGSIRQPAACCGVVGIKPTYGRVSRYGLVAFGSSLDQIGPLTRDVRDAALVLNVICGLDEMDSTSAKVTVPDFLKNLDDGVRGIRIGVPKEYFAQGLDPGVKSAVLSAVDKLKSLGGEPVDVSMPHTEYAIAAYYIIATAEASSNLARYDGVKYGFRKPDAQDLREMYKDTRSEGFGAEVKRRIMLGNYVLSSGYYDAYYKKAQQVRSLIAEDFKKAFEKCDILICPTMPTPPFELGEKLDDPLAMYLSDVYTTSLNLAGLPGMTLPFGQAGSMPVGVQLIGKGFDEETVLKVGQALTSS
jgi:aspartyl-tRNA(Asn)/glutamyl-tRNA(Gln) amidotransferase subunit A